MLFPEIQTPQIIICPKQGGSLSHFIWFFLDKLVNDELNATWYFIFKDTCGTHGSLFQLIYKYTS